MVDRSTARVAFGMIGVSVALAPLFFAINAPLMFPGSFLNWLWPLFSLGGLVVTIPWMIVTSPISAGFILYAYFNE